MVAKGEQEQGPQRPRTGQMEEPRQWKHAANPGSFIFKREKIRIVAEKDTEITWGLSHVTQSHEGRRERAPEEETEGETMVSTFSSGRTFPSMVHGEAGADSPLR